MSLRRATPPLLLAAAVLVTLLLIRGGDDRYTVKLLLANASGLKEGGEVRLGGVEIGTISDLRLDRADRVVATLALDDDRAPIGRDAAVAIATRNLLGQKYIDLDPGDRGRPLPSGSTIASSRVGTPTDLDQVLNVLDADTRTRLQILVNEAGVALTGRKVDFNQALRLLPPSVVQLGRVLDSVNADGRTISRLVDNSDHLVGAIAAERDALGALVTSAGGAASNVAARRAALAETLRRAPTTLRTAQRFLADLRSAAAPLRPAAARIAQTAPPMTAALRELQPVRAAAAPALARARAAAPALTRLADGATPVLARSRPAVTALANLAEDAPPLTRTVNASIDDLLGVLHGWAAAIQTRDGLSHSFRVRATLSTDAVLTLIRRLDLLQNPQKRKQARARKRPAKTAPAVATPPTAKDSKPSAAAIPTEVKNAIDGVIKTVDAITESLTGKTPDSGGASSVKPLLDYLLGG